LGEVPKARLPDLHIRFAENPDKEGEVFELQNDFDRDASREKQHWGQQGFTYSISRQRKLKSRKKFFKTALGRKQKGINKGGGPGVVKGVL